MSDLLRHLMTPTILIRFPFYGCRSLTYLHCIEVTQGYLCLCGCYDDVTNYEAAHITWTEIVGWLVLKTILNIHSKIVWKVISIVLTNMVHLIDLKLIHGRFTSNMYSMQINWTCDSKTIIGKMTYKQNLLPLHNCLIEPIWYFYF